MSDGGTPVRMLVVWWPDWPVVAAGAALDEPVAVVHANRVVACSPAARGEGIRLDMRRRDAQACCPELLILSDDPAGAARAFEPVAVALEALTPRIQVVHPGCVAFPTRGPSRYHGGDLLLARAAARLAQAAGPPAGPLGVVGAGVADGLFAATLAARRAATLAVKEGVEAENVLVVEVGESGGFLAPLPMRVLDRPDLVDVLRRLGLRTLGDLAALPEGNVVGRFGTEGWVAQRLAAGLDPRPSATLPPPPDLQVSVELDPPAERVETAAFAARGLADELHRRLTRRGSACTLLLIGAETEHGERHERTWRTDGSFGPAAIADRLRWQLDAWLTTTPAPGAGSDATTGSHGPVPGDHRTGRGAVASRGGTGAGGGSTGADHGQADGVLDGGGRSVAGTGVVDGDRGSVAGGRGAGSTSGAGGSSGTGPRNSGTGPGREAVVGSGGTGPASSGGGGHRRPDIANGPVPVGRSVAGAGSSVGGRSVDVVSGGGGAVAGGGGTGTGGRGSGAGAGVVTGDRGSVGRSRGAGVAGWGVRPTGGVTRLWLYPVEVVAAGGRQLSFGAGGGDAVIAAEQAGRAAARVQSLVGVDGVLLPEWRGGRGPGERVALVDAGGATLTEPRPAARPEWIGEPWPGTVPDPAPGSVHPSAPPVRLLDENGYPVRVSGRGVLSADPVAMADREHGRPVPIVRWAGPWPCDERWWDPAGHRRRARLQVITTTGAAHLLVVESGRWTLEATYD